MSQVSDQTPNKFYPKTPSDVPKNLTSATASYKKHAWLAMAGLMFFMVFYISLMLCFAWLTYKGAMAISAGDDSFAKIILTVIALMLTIFMAKSLFSARKSGDPDGIEVTAKDEPRLFEFLHTLADEIGAPKPHRVFLTSEVNAAVFYDLTLLNLVFPSKKNLIVGLGLVNVLNLGELKAVLAHEFGHFAQGSMVVGRWVYVAQQIISYMVSTRDWLDKLVSWVSRFDLRIAWLGWVLTIILWSIRSLMDTLFSLVIMAERALSREMEFNADLVAVSVTGSDALVNALHKLQSADYAWQTAMNLAQSQAGQGKLIQDLFTVQEKSISEMKRVLDDEHYGTTPVREDGVEPQDHRVFTEQSARPPQMWATHPPSSDREENAKNIYVRADIDKRQAWVVFSNPSDLRRKLTKRFYNPDKVAELEEVSSTEAVLQRFSRSIYANEYRGAYLRRSPVRRFSSVNEMLEHGEVSSSIEESLKNLYPRSLSDDLEVARNLDIERDTLEALRTGDLKPSGGVIRHRGKELKKAEIPDAIQDVLKDRTVVADKLKAHDASCRRAHLQIAQQTDGEWHVYLKSIIEQLHFAEHLLAVVDNEHARVINTWSVITADKQIGYFEKRRMIDVCSDAHQVMIGVSESIAKASFSEAILLQLGVDNWEHQRPVFDFKRVTKKNWADWVQSGSETMNYFSQILGAAADLLLEELIDTEEKLRKTVTHSAQLGQVPKGGVVPASYPTLLPGQEHTLQRKLDFWNRFQLAQGFTPTLLRLIVSLGIVGGTLYGSIINL